MIIDTCHFEIHVQSLDEARRFYVEVLGLELLQDTPALRMIAVRAGAVRISIFADAESKATGEAAAARCHVIFRSDHLEATIARLRGAGIRTPETISEASGFMRCIAVHDPSGNLLEIAQYLRDPRAAI